MFSLKNVSIDLVSLLYNLRKIKTLAPQSKVLAMVKCNAYGHGVVEVARKIADEIAAFGVMYLQEALQLSDAGITRPIVILTGFFTAEELYVIGKRGYACVVHNFEQLEILEKSVLVQPLHVWLKIDTGMHRLGFPLSRVKEVYQRLLNCRNVHKPLYLMTHFSDADDRQSSRTEEQYECFLRTVENLDGELCLANSAAIMHWPKTHGVWIRPGLLLYGASPSNYITGLQLGFKPVMTFSSYIVAVHELARGEAIGYGSIFRCLRDMRVGTVAIGYGDGYPRNAKFSPVLVDGVRSAVLGRVAMDMLSVDLSNISSARVGSQVILWGDGLPVEEVAEYCGEIAYELFTRVTSRVKYNFYG